MKKDTESQWKIGRRTHSVACRNAPAIGMGGGFAQRGTLSEDGANEIICVGMGPGQRHITKPVCEITYALREEGFHVSVLVLEAGMGPPEDAPGGMRTSVSGINEKEVARINAHKLAILHFGNIPGHFLYKARLFLRHVYVPAIIVCQAPVKLEDFAAMGINVRGIEVERPETQGMILDVITGVIRGQSVPPHKMREIISKTKFWFNFLKKSFGDENEKVSGVSRRN
jgi:methyl-coenzyme M reductase subunit C